MYVVADETTTGGGANLGGDVNTGGGDFAGRDKIRQIVNVERDNLDDLRTDIHLIKDDIAELKFAEYDMRARIEDLRREIVRSQPPQATSAQPLSPVGLAILLVCIFIVSFVVAFILFLFVRKSF